MHNVSDSIASGLYSGATVRDLRTKALSLRKFNSTINTVMRYTQFIQFAVD